MRHATEGIFGRKSRRSLGSGLSHAAESLGEVGE